MRCPSCNHRESRVLDSRPVEDESSIKRRRECAFCGKRFTTYEVVDTVPIAVVKRSGDREFFDKHKLKLGIERACQKRPVDAALIANEIESDLQNAIVAEITSKDIGERTSAKWFSQSSGIWISFRTFVSLRYTASSRILIPLWRRSAV